MAAEVAAGSPSSSIGYTFCFGRWQLPFLQQQQLKQLWWFVQSAKKQWRSIEENNSLGAQPHEATHNGKTVKNNISLARIVRIYPRHGEEGGESHALRIIVGLTPAE
jgi:hypothetical protein